MPSNNLIPSEMLHSKQDRAFRSAERLAKLREELVVVEEQIAALQWEADDAHLRALVTENVADRREDVDATRHVEALRRAKESLRSRIEKAEVEHQRLVQRLFPE
jgi:SMC interacting uncharacterized protein involved in chromosome segregation